MYGAANFPISTPAPTLPAGEVTSISAPLSRFQFSTIYRSQVGLREKIGTASFCIHRKSPSSNTMQSMVVAFMLLARIVHFIGVASGLSCLRMFALSYGPSS